MIPGPRRAFLLLIVLLTIWAGHAAIAQSVDDFKAAVDKDGCESIPYSDLRSGCNDKQQDVHTGETCDGPRSCQGLETDKFEERIKIENMCLNTLKPLRDGFSNQKSELESDEEKRLIENVISEIQTEIDAAGSKIDASKRSIEANRGKINSRITTGEKCRKSRETVQAFFDQAMSKAKDESDPDIKPLADQLVSKWEASTRDHNGEVDRVNKVIDDCKKLL